MGIVAQPTWGTEVILLVDNYDSFTFNVYQALAATGAEILIRRNDEGSVSDWLALEPHAVLLSPGPGKPSEAGLSPELVAKLPESTPLLGICLGHQILIEHEGGAICRDKRPIHGRSSPVAHEGDPLLESLPNPFLAGRYHSLHASGPLPKTLRRIAWTEDDLVMGVKHRTLPRWGVQFHPESILSPDGARILQNFVSQVPRVAAKS